MTDRPPEHDPAGYHLSRRRWTRGEIKQLLETAAELVVLGWDRGLLTKTEANGGLLALGDMLGESELDTLTEVLRSAEPMLGVRKR